MTSFDIIVLGAGPGGYVAAVRAAQHGLSVAVVERDAQLGGTCLLRGCIPTKSLLHAADLVQKIGHAHRLGIGDGKATVDFKKVQAERQAQVDKGAAGVQYLFKKNKVTQFAGHGRLVDRLQVEVDSGARKETLVAKRGVIIATGSTPKGLPGLPLDGKRIVSSDELLQVSKPPKSMVVLGAGAVGVEFASVFSRFGTACTIVEAMPRLVPQEDEEISREFTKILRKQGIVCRPNTKFVRAKSGRSSIDVTVQAAEDKAPEETLTAELLLLATGRKPLTDDIGLARLGIAVDARGYIPVNGLMQTQVESVFAIGDVVATPWLAHVASAEGMIAADTLAGRPARPLNYLHTPGCTYSQPEIGSIGLTEAAAKARGYTVKIGKHPFSAVPKARILGETDGMVKVVTDARYGEVLGVHIVGPHATDLIAEGGLALGLECTAEEMAHTMHAHPSLAEGLLEAAHAAHDRAIHI